MRKRTSQPLGLDLKEVQKGLSKAVTTQWTESAYLATATPVSVPKDKKSEGSKNRR